MNGVPVYATAGLKNTVPPDLLDLLWKLYFDRLKRPDPPADYLQIFELKEALDEEGNTVQEIIHRQERPPHHETHYIPTDQTINQKIFVIEEEHYITMLLAEEY